MAPRSLTDVLLKSLKAPTTGRLEVADARCAGLVLRMTPAGIRSFSFRFRDPKSGKVSRATLGTYPDLSLADARDKANEYRGTVARGTNPVEAKRRAKNEAGTKTFKALADRYMEEHARRFKRSADEDERNLKLHVNPRWGKRRFDEIRKADVIELAEGLVKAGKPVLANRVQSLVSKIFSFAEDAGLVEVKPFARLKRRGTENVGTRVLDNDELRLFWERIVQKPVTRRVGLALRLELLTATRPGEVAGLSLSELQNLDDPSKAMWVLPKERSKNGRAHLVPLSPLAVDTIKEALKLVEKGDQFLFPSPSKERDAITSHALSVAMARFAKELNKALPGAKTWKAEAPTPHDLRRTAATRLSELGISKEDRDAVMNHTRSDVGSKHYDLYDRAKEKRIALNVLAATITTVIENKGGGEVVPLVRPTRKKK